MNTHGLHHVTAVTGNAAGNLDFYTKVLGLRLVKKTVNQDDVSAYHLFYADAEGNPGTDMTFFDWKFVSPKREGGDQVSRTYFRVLGSDALAYWSDRFSAYKVSHSGVVKVHGREAILFEDLEGQHLGLVSDEGVAFSGKVWDRVIPVEHALRGFYAVELSVPYLDTVHRVCTDIMGWVEEGTYADPINGAHVTVFGMDGGGPGKEVHVRELPEADQYLGSTAGSVHHIAFRVQDHDELEAWQRHLETLYVPHSGLIDRFYFKSLYFRISPGILFEIATDGPGFATDEDLEHLGESLSLPPFLEPHRQEIEAGLTPL